MTMWIVSGDYAWAIDGGTGKLYSIQCSECGRWKFGFNFKERRAWEDIALHCGFDHVKDGKPCCDVFRGVGSRW